MLPDHNCVIWAIDINELNKLLPTRYSDKLKKQNVYFFTIDMLKDVETLDQYDKDMESGGSHSAMVVLEPPSIDQRIINQYSYFSIIPKRMENIEDFLDNNTIHTKKYIIDKSIRWEIRDFLDILNLNERIIFPGLDGVAAWLKRYYYVK